MAKLVFALFVAIAFVVVIQINGNPLIEPSVSQRDIIVIKDANLDSVDKTEKDKEEHARFADFTANGYQRFNAERTADSMGNGNERFNDARFSGYTDGGYQTFTQTRGKPSGKSKIAQTRGKPSEKSKIDRKEQGYNTPEGFLEHVNKSKKKMERIDERNCPIRRLEEMEPCKKSCNYGFKLDKEGCEICECADFPVTPVSSCELLPPTCNILCENGFKQDAEGCDICECEDSPILDDKKPEECKDIYSFCDYWAKQGECKKKQYMCYMDKFCKKSCGVCTSNKYDKKPEECKDLDPSCVYSARQGICNKKEYKCYMNKFCRKSCDLCTFNKHDKKPEECKDLDPICETWAKQGECKKKQYTRYMDKYCKKSCGVCTFNKHSNKGDECRDRKWYCPYWAKQGECKKDPRHMHIYCKKSCGLCIECKDLSQDCINLAEKGECEKHHVSLMCKESCGICEDLPWLQWRPRGYRGRRNLWM